MRYEFVDDLTSDVFFHAYGKDIKEVFENSAEAMFSVICDIERVRHLKKIELTVEADNLQELLFSYLQELIALVDVEEMFFSRFKIVDISDRKVRAEAYGEPMTKEKGMTVVKAVTNYKFGIVKNDKGYQASISLDI